MQRLAVAALLLIALVAGGASALAQVTKVATDVRTVSAFPRVGSYQVLACDFHMHTVHSDGKLTSRERVIEAYNYGYDAIAVTDHGKTDAYTSARSLADALGVVLIRGSETGIDGTEHMVVLGVSGNYRPRDAHRLAEEPGQGTAFYRDELRSIDDAGGLVIYAHPHKGFREPVKWGIQQGIMVGIEVKNFVVGSGWNTVESHGTYCYPFAFDWALENNLALFADSDLHGARTKESCPVTLVFAEEKSSRGVLEAIRARRTVAQFDGMLWGRDELLSQLIGAAVSVRRTSDARGGDYVFIRNNGPLSLRATLDDERAPAESVEVPALKELMMRWDNPPGQLRIRWENVWTSPTRNLITTHTL